MDKEMLKKKLHEQMDAMDDEVALQMLHALSPKKYLPM